MATLSKLVGTHFPQERVKLQIPVLLKDRWVGVWRFAFFPSWYPAPVEIIQTKRFLFFDRRRANMIKAGVYGIISFVLISILVTLFFGYLSVFWVAYSFIVAVIIYLLLFLGGRSLTYGIIAVHTDWVERVTPKDNTIVINGRKPPDICRSIVCAMETDSRKRISLFEKTLQAIDISPVYEMFGWMDWFEVRYQAVEQ